MKVPLDPATKRKLKELARHRRMIITRRGVSATLFTFLGAVTAVALIDRAVVLPDGGRWTLTVFAYAFSAAVAWRLWFRPLLRSPDERALARFVEKAHPSLREDLISAVELGAGEAADASLDSPVFRRILQESVARRIEGVEPQTVLPPSLVRKWIALCVGAAVIFAALFAIPDLKFDRLVLRALFPMANLARVSSTRVTILEPQPPDAVVPRGDKVRILVEISGPRAEEVLLDVFRPDRAPVTVTMERAGGDRRYVSEIQTDEKPLAYRIRAGDAVTRKYTITTRPRPYVSAFDITYRYPSYTGWPDRSEKGRRRGDLEALSGTVATVRIRTDQPVSEGLVEMEQGGEFSQQPVRVIGPKLLEISFPLKAEGAYKVLLVASETRFDNRPVSPTYEIKAIPDARPVVRLQKPEADLLLPPDAVVHLEGTARDDIGLGEVLRLFRINDGAWSETVLSEAPAAASEAEKEIPLSDSLDLFDLKVEPGDSVTVKFAALDLKGSRGESRPVTILIRSRGSSLADFARLEKSRAVLKELGPLEKDLSILEERTRSLGKKVSSGAGGDSATEETLSFSEKVEEEISSVQEKIGDALNSVERGADAFELTVLVNTLDGVSVRWIKAGRKRLREALGAPDPKRKRSLLREAQSAFRKAREETRDARGFFSKLVLADESALLTGDLAALDRNQARAKAVVETEGAEGKRKWLARESVAVRELEAAEKRFLEFSKRTKGRPADTGKRVARSLKAAAERVSALLREVRGLRDLTEAAREAFTLTRKARSGWIWENAGLAREASRARAELKKRTSFFNEIFVPLIKAVFSNRPEAEELWRRTVSLFEARGKREEARPDSDERYVGDLDLTARALKGLHGRWKADSKGREAAAELKKVSEAFRKLEAGHELSELIALLEELGDRERWSFRESSTFTETPEDWDYAEEILRWIPQHLLMAHLPRRAYDIVSKARNGAPVKRIHNEMAERRTKFEEPSRVDGDLRRLASQLREAQAALEGELAKARNAIARSAPSLAELMNQAAEKARETSKEMAQAASRIENASEREREETFDRLTGEQDSLSQEVTDIADALRRDAALQDVMTESGRERARDSEAASRMVTRPAAEATEALNQAVSSPRPSAAAENLKAASEKENELADLLDRLAEHYSKLEAGEDVAATRSFLRSREKELALGDSLESSFDSARKLGELSSLSPQELLGELEKELGRNAEMQRELGSLAEDSLEGARAELLNAYETESGIANEVAGAAKKDRGQVETLLGRLRQVAEKTRELLNRNVPAISEAAREGRLEPKALSEVKRAAQALNRAVSAAGGRVSSRKDLSESARRAAEALKEAQNGFLETAKAGEKAFKSAQAGPVKNAAGKALKQAATSAISAGSLALQAQRIAAAAQKRPAALPRQLAQRHEPVGPAVERAAQVLDRVARHRKRLGQEAEARALGELAGAARRVAQGEVARAAQALRSGSPQAAESAVRGAREAIGRTIRNLEAFAAALASAREAGAAPDAASAAGPSSESSGGKPQASGASRGTRSPFSGETGRTLARALDEADRNVFGEGQAPPAGPSQAGRLLSQAARSQLRSSRGASRGRPVSPSSSPVSEGVAVRSRFGASLDMPPTGSGELPELSRTRTGEKTWWKLPPRLARGLMEARREGFAEEYRKMIETYFKVIAEKARKKSE